MKVTEHGLENTGGNIMRLGYTFEIGNDTFDVGVFDSEYPGYYAVNVALASDEIGSKAICVGDDFVFHPDEQICDRVIPRCVLTTTDDGALADIVRAAAATLDFLREVSQYASDGEAPENFDLDFAVQTVLEANGILAGDELAQGGSLADMSYDEALVQVLASELRSTDLEAIFKLADLAYGILCV